MRGATLFGYRMRRFHHNAGGHTWRLKRGAYTFSVTRYPYDARLQFNARIEAGGQSGTGPLTVTLPAGTQQATFLVTRLSAGQAVTVPLTVVDSCGEWPTVVGGGASAL